MHDLTVVDENGSRQGPGVRAKTEEFLYFLLWTCETLWRPTFRNLTSSFEGWAYRNGFLHALAELERRKLIESWAPAGAPGNSPLRVRRLTEAGRLHALGGRDPEACWKRPWNGRWHLVVYDLPAAEGTARNRLRNVLRSRGFGWLQNSVWISPHPLPGQEALVAGAGVDVESLLFLEARPSGGESNEEVVAGAWDFEAINRRYARHLKVLATCPQEPLTTEAAARALREWTRQERGAWNVAVAEDPLLPECLLPKGYLGRQAWMCRMTTLGEAAARMRAFQG